MLIKIIDSLINIIRERKITASYMEYIMINLNSSVSHGVGALRCVQGLSKIPFKWTQREINKLQFNRGLLFINVAHCHLLHSALHSQEQQLFQTEQQLFQVREWKVKC